MRAAFARAGFEPPPLSSAPPQKAQRTLDRELRSLLERLTREHGVEFEMPATNGDANRMIDELLSSA